MRNEPLRIRPDRYRQFGAPDESAFCLVTNTSLMHRFQIEEKTKVELQRVDEALEHKQVERLCALRARRDHTAWQAAIEQIEVAAKSGGNLMPHIIHAVECLATVGEISDAMRGVFGEYREAVVI